MTKSLTAHKTGKSIRPTLYVKSVPWLLRPRKTVPPERSLGTGGFGCGVGGRWGVGDMYLCVCVCVSVFRWSKYLLVVLEGRDGRI